MSRILRFNDFGPDVGEVQTKLNCLNQTRLPRLAINNTYDSGTMARVMEFQAQQGISTDGIFGPHTKTKLAHSKCVASPAAPSGRCLVVDLIKNKLLAVEGGTVFLTADPIRGGSASDPTRRGVFHMSQRRLRHHTSAEFPEPPDNMQFAMFFDGGRALHLGPNDLESHGCIHVGLPEIETVFNWAGKTDILVIVLKTTP